MSKFGVFSGLFVVRMRENTHQKKLCIGKLFHAVNIKISNYLSFCKLDSFSDVAFLKHLFDTRKILDDKHFMFFLNPASHIEFFSDIKVPHATKILWIELSWICNTVNPIVSLWKTFLRTVNHWKNFICFINDLNLIAHTFLSIKQYSKHSSNMLNFLTI